MSDKNSAIATFDRHEQAEEAVKQLQQAGFDMKKLSIVSKAFQTEENVVGYYTTGERRKILGRQTARSGVAFGDCCSARRSSLFQASVHCSWPGRSSPPSSVPWRPRPWSAGSAPSALRSTASASPRKASCNTRHPSKPASSCWWSMERPMKSPAPSRFCPPRCIGHAVASG